MKGGYLTRFIEKEAEKSFEKPLPSNPPKPSKPSFGGFNSKQMITPPIFQEQDCSPSVNLPWVKNDLIQQQDTEANLIIPDKVELNSLQEIQSKSAREVVAELIALHHCPDGCGPMNLQDRARDAWFCPHCRIWVIAGVIQ